MRNPSTSKTKMWSVVSPTGQDRVVVVGGVQRIDGDAIERELAGFVGDGLAGERGDERGVVVIRMEMRGSAICSDAVAGDDREGRVVNVDEGCGWPRGER